MKTLNEFEFGTQQIGKSTYDWDTILNGEIHVLEAGKDFTCKPANMKTQARMVAKKRGLRVRTGSTEEGVVIQAFSISTEDTTQVSTKETNNESTSSEAKTNKTPKTAKSSRRSDSQKR